MSSDHQARYDDAMFDYSTGDFAGAIAKLRSILTEDPRHFDAQLSVAMCHYRLGDFATAITEGHKAEKLRPKEQLVHTNLSLFYMKAGNRAVAEHHGLRARVAGWGQDLSQPGSKPSTGPEDPELRLAQPKPKAFKMPEKFPEMPWKKNAKPGDSPKPGGDSPPPASSPDASPSAG